MNISDEAVEAAARAEKVEQIIATIEDSIFALTGQHVLSSGSDGKLNLDGWRVALLLDDALRKAK